MQSAVAQALKTYLSEAIKATPTPQADFTSAARQGIHRLSSCWGWRWQGGTDRM